MGCVVRACLDGRVYRGWIEMPRLDVFIFSNFLKVSFSHMDLSHELARYVCDIMAVFSVVYATNTVLRRVSPASSLCFLQVWLTDA